MAKRISDEIRKWADDAYSGREIRTTKYLYAIADRIDAEMVELPIDDDGVPIHVGDTVYDESGVACEVASIGFWRWSGGMMVYAVDGSHQWRDLIPGQLAHTRSDSWERIACDIETGVPIDDDGDERLRHELADRIRRLADKEDKR